MVQVGQSAVAGGAVGNVTNCGPAASDDGGMEPGVAEVVGWGDGVVDCVAATVGPGGAALATGLFAGPGGDGDGVTTQPTTTAAASTHAMTRFTPAETAQPAVMRRAA